MFENVAVIHVWMLGVSEVRKFSDDAHCRMWIDEYGILETPLVRQRWLTIAFKHTKLYVVDME